jgi:predicted Ser/Thr protein kinase
MQAAETALNRLCQNIKDQGRRSPMGFKEFLGLAAEHPDIVFRDIFRLFCDMITGYVGDGIDEYPDDPESINYVSYDCSRLFEEGTDYPFFADRLFANRLVNLVNSFRRGLQQNRIYIFEGPHGCGKSTFLNNLLMKFEQYAKTEEGACFETVWRLDKRELGVSTEHEAHALLAQLRSLVNESGLSQRGVPRDNLLMGSKKEYLEVPCPSHDHPLLIIPKAYRKEIFQELILDTDFKKRLFTEKQYEWVFRNSPCTICSSLYQTLLDIVGSPSKVFLMVFARRYLFNRRLGEGISVFNPGDRSAKTRVMSNPLLQHQLDTLLRDSNRVKYIFSRYAKTNNGIHALMDIKGHNKERFSNLHGIISEGVHKVEDIEENVNSLFLALMNPEDRGTISVEQSFADRITYIKIPYVLDYNTEVKIYKDVFGNQIETLFLPRILQNFAKVLLSSRLKEHSEGLLEWIGDSERYKLYCDQNLLLLKMDIYTGLIPSWLAEEDRKNFTAKRRRRIIAESEHEGDKGFSGRDSIKIFSEFYSSYALKDKLINMGMVCNFFRKHRRDLVASIPEGFLDSLVRFYDYTVLQEVKESLYYYNEERISKDIQNYLFAVNFDLGRTETSIYTGEEIEINEAFFDGIERRILGDHPESDHQRSFREDIQNQYASRTLTQEMMVEGRGIKETEIYRALHERYIHNLKEKVLDPFMKNGNFRRAIKDYASETFKAYDKRIRDEVDFLIKNLKEKYGYTEQGAKEVCIYVVDNDLAKAFSVH